MPSRVSDDERMAAIQKQLDEKYGPLTDDRQINTTIGNLRWMLKVSRENSEQMTLLAIRRGLIPRYHYRPPRQKKAG